MSTITLEAIKAEQSKLSAMIAAFEKQPVFPISVPFPELNEGELAVGVVITADGIRREWIILLPGEYQGSWQASMDWAKSMGGELPDRVESSLMFSQPDIRSQFQEAAYWTCNSYGSSGAWYQGFLYGYQYYYDSSHKLWARAIRRIPI